MVRPAAGVGDERGEPLPVELRDDRRRELVGDEDQRPLEVLEEVERIPAGAQVHAQAADDVADVSLALAQVRVVRLVEERGDLLERALQRRVGVQALGADDVGRALDQHRVVEHQQLGVEEVGVLGAGRRARCAP